MARPRGEIRHALRSAFAARDHATWSEVLPAVPGVNCASRAEVTLVRRTVENMVQDGELVRCGSVRAASSGRWRVLYELAPLGDAGCGSSTEASGRSTGDSLDMLQDVTRSWLAGS